MFRFGLRPGSRFAGGVHCVVQVDEPKPVARCTAGRLKFVERAVYSARFFGRGEVEACRTVIVYGSENVVERHFVDVPSGGEGHFAVVVRIPDFDQQSRAHELVQELYGIWDTLNQNKMLEAWHDAQQIREEGLDLFSHGIVDLKTRAQIERLYWSITREINQIAEGLKHAPDEFRGLSKLLADKYFCNFSLFQSLPDSWAIDQIFPIMPIQRLDEKPDRSATLQDITCDSDGKIANFISTRNVAHYLPVHSLKKTEPYYVAVFLVGAYQEILGDMHNLFGDTNAVHVSVNEKGYSIEQIIDGETVAEVLDYVQYNPKKLVRTLETWVTKSVKEGKISLEEGKEFLSNYRSGLYGYTYLE